MLCAISFDTLAPFSYNRKIWRAIFQMISEFVDIFGREGKPGRNQRFGFRITGVLAVI
jgi:hypothetical protein